MSVNTTEIVTAHLRGKFEGPLKGTSTRRIEVTITGKRDLARLAGGIERAGNPSLAAQVRVAKSFKCTVSPEQWAAMREAAK